MNTLFASLLIGGGLGALLGYFGRCSSGACPLTANWRRGAVYGAALGLMFHFATGNSLSPYPRSQHVKAVSEAAFDAEVTHAGKPVVVDLYAPWCGPCKVMARRLDELAAGFDGRIKFVSVNVDQAPALSARFQVQAIPRLLFIGKDGSVIDSSVGLISGAELGTKLAALASR